MAWSFDNMISNGFGIRSTGTLTKNFPQFCTDVVVEDNWKPKSESSKVEWNQLPKKEGKRRLRSSLKLDGDVSPFDQFAVSCSRVVNACPWIFFRENGFGPRNNVKPKRRNSDEYEFHIASWSPFSVKFILLWCSSLILWSPSQRSVHIDVFKQVLEIFAGKMIRIINWTFDILNKKFNIGTYLKCEYIVLLCTPHFRYFHHISFT